MSQIKLHTDAGLVEIVNDDEFKHLVLDLDSILGFEFGSDMSKTSFEVICKNNKPNMEIREIINSDEEFQKLIECWKIYKESRQNKNIN